MAQEEIMAREEDAIVISVHIKVAHLTIWRRIGGSLESLFYAIELIFISLETLITTSKSFLTVRLDSSSLSRC